MEAQTFAAVRVAAADSGERNRILTWMDHSAGQSWMELNFSWGELISSIELL